MNLSLFIARRYLFAKKSHNVINIISAISATGMAIGTAALIIILSVFNGFNDLIEKNLNDIDPDILVTPVHGKAFVPQGDGFDWLAAQEQVASTSCYLEENVFVNYGGAQDLATARGVDSSFVADSPLRTHVMSGEFKLRHGEIPLCAVGSSFAYAMGINPRFVTPLEIYYPNRTRSISLANPAASLEKLKIRASCTFSIDAEKDKTLIILPIEEMRTLLQYDDEVSAMEIRVREDCSAKEVKSLLKGLSQKLGPEYKVSDRYRQNESLYKMMRYEKAAIFLILIFVIIIIAFNIFGSLSMLIIEKKGDIETLGSLGAPDTLVRRIFILEGWLISLLGLAAGLVAGLAFALIQQHFGIIRMPGNFLISSYPVIIRWTDVLLTVVGVATIGYVIALLPVASYYKKTA